MSARAVIEIRPYRGGWQCFEAPGVAPYFIGSDAKEEAIEYATQRIKSQSGEIHVLDGRGTVEKVLTFSAARRICGHSGFH